MYLRRRFWEGEGEGDNFFLYTERQKMEQAMLSLQRMAENGLFLKKDWKRKVFFVMFFKGTA